MAEKSEKSNFHPSLGGSALCPRVHINIGNSYWAIFVTVAAELFETNLRATVATTVPNFVRGSPIPLTAAPAFLNSDWGIINAGLIVGAKVYLLSFPSLGTLEETFDRELDFEEG